MRLHYINEAGPNLQIVREMRFYVQRMAAMHTGLDSTSSAQLVDILAGLSMAGVNIVFSIHQPRPDILRHMDTLLLLSPVGQLVFCGPLGPLPEHLSALGCPPPAGTLNIADFLLDVVISSGSRRLAALVEGFERSAIQSRELGLVEQVAAASGAAGVVAPPPPPPLPPLGLQLRVLSATLFRRTYRHPFLVATCYVATLLASIGLAVAFLRTDYDTQVRHASSWRPLSNQGTPHSTAPMNRVHACTRRTNHDRCSLTDAALVSCRAFRTALGYCSSSCSSSRSWR